MLNFLSTLQQLDSQQRDFLSKLYESQKNRMLAAAMSIINNRNHAEEMVHRAFLKLIDKVDLLMSFKSESKAAGYAYITVRNTTLDFVRKYKRDIPLEYLPNLPATADTENIIIRSEEIATIATTLGSLRLEHFEAVYLRFVLELKYEEIGNILGIKKDNAKQRVYAAIRKIRKNMDWLREVLNGGK